MSRAYETARPFKFKFRAMNTDVEVQLVTAGREEAEHAAALVKTGLKHKSSASVGLYPIVN